MNSMRILIAEDDLVSRRFLYKFLSRYGDCDLVIDGLEAIDAYLISLKDNTPYDLICLDVMMAKVDGVNVLKRIREMESRKGILGNERVKIIMTTALIETHYIQNALELGCDAYEAKPFDTVRFVNTLSKLGL